MAWRPGVGIRSQPTPRFLTQPPETDTASKSADRQKQDAGPNVLFDFSKIPVFARERQNRDQTSSPLVQPNIIIGQVDDPLEREADRVADQVMRMPTPNLTNASARLQLTRKCTACEAEEEKQTLQLSWPKAAPGEASAIVHQMLRSSGRPLEASTRAYFEPHFRWNFGAVRIHNDEGAARAAQKFHAAAFTVGAEIGFATGRYDPESGQGRALLAHELAHVVQNAAKPTAGPPVLARQTVEQYERRGITIGRTELNKLAGFTYWEQKLQDYGFVYRGDVPTDKRLKNNPDEFDAVLSVVWQVRPQSPTITQAITQVVTIPKRPAPGSQDLAYRVTFSPSATKGHRGIVDVVFLAEGSGVGAIHASRQAVPPGYASHDFADENIEQAQNPLDPKKQDKLGKLNDIDKVPTDERASVKYAIWQYFESGTRNAEVDAIVPIANAPAVRAAGGKQRRVLYTFRFKPTTNDVDIQRIGEEGKDVSLASQGELARVNGYLNQVQGLSAMDPAPESLKKWVQQRYKAVTIAPNPTVADLEKDVTAQIRGGSKDSKWYDANYMIKVLDKTQAADWIKNNVDKDERQLVDLKNFDETTGLPLLELVLETMSDAIVRTFANVRFVRQAVHFEWNQAKGDFDKQPEVSGITQGSAERTIRIYDNAFINIDALFLGGIGPGGKRDVKISPAETFAHELGHVVSYGYGVQQAFDELVADKGIKPITWYAAKDPPKELFPEAFALFYSDPEWLQNNWPDLFKFFDDLDKAGPPQKPGAPKKTRTPPKKPGKPVP
jgi:hypothetical protein